MAEKYFGSGHNFVQRFNDRKEAVLNNNEVTGVGHPIQESEIPEGEDCMYYSVPPQYTEGNYVPQENMEEMVDSRPRRIGRRTKLEPLAQSQDPQIKSALIEQLSEKTKQQEEEIKKMRELLHSKTITMEAKNKKKKTVPLSQSANQQKETPAEENNSAVSEKKSKELNNKESQSKEQAEGEEDDFARAPEAEAEPEFEPEVDQVEEKNKAEEMQKIEKQKEEEMKKLEEELKEKAKKEIEDLKKEKEKELAELKAANEKKQQEIEKQKMLELQAKYEQEKAKLREEAEKAALKEKEQLANELKAMREKLKNFEKQPKPIVEPPPVEPPKKIEPIKVSPPEVKQPPANTTSKPPIPEKNNTKPNTAAVKENKSEVPAKIPQKKEEPAVEEQDIPQVNKEVEYYFARILYNNEIQYKLTVYAKSDAEEKFNIKISLNCIENPAIKIRDEILDDSNIRQILTATSLTDVMPYSIQVRGSNEIENIAKYGIAPFAQVK